MLLVVPVSGSYSTSHHASQYVSVSNIPILLQSQYVVLKLKQGIFSRNPKRRAA
jgi:hypothetical protein